MTLQQSHPCVRCGATIEPGDVFSAVDVLDGDGDLRALLCEECGDGLRAYVDGGHVEPDVPAESQSGYSIVEALGADRGVTCVVGAGGKKTTLYALATRLSNAIVTATVRIPIFDSHVSRVAVGSDPLSALPAGADENGPLGLVAEREDDRYRGFAPETIDSIAALHTGPVLVKADGARTREFKAPNASEPRIPAATRTVVPIVSAHAVGEPLTEAAVHRPERVASLTGLDLGDEITPEAIAEVLASPEGGLKDVPRGARVIPLINKVDTDEDAAVAHKIADRLFETVAANPFGPDVRRVVLARMVDAEVVSVRLA